MSQINRIHGLEIDELEGDRLSSRVRQIRKISETPVSFEQRVAQGKALCDKVSYLEEPFLFLESDPDHQVVVLRSQKPQENEAEIRYFEVKLEPQAITLERYHFLKATGEREPLDFVLTHANLERLGQDLS